MRSSGTTGERNVTFISTLPATSNVNMLLVEVYSKDFWFTFEPTSSGAPIQT